MKTLIKNQKTTKTKPVYFKQAIVGLELGSTDHAILNYLNFFNQKVAIESALFIKVVPTFDLYKALFEKEVPALSESIATNEEIRFQLKKKVNNHFHENDFTEFGYLVEEGNTLDKILEAGQNLEADLLVIGHKNNTDRQNIKGKNLIRQTNSISLIIPEKTKAQLSKILVPIDFSDDSQQAIQQAVRIKKQIGASVKVVALHVYQVPRVNPQKINSLSSTFQQERIKNLLEGFNAFLYTALGEDANQVEIAVQEAEHQDTPRTINNFAKQNNTDLMVVGARGHSKVHLLLMGSTTESLIDLNREIPMMVTKY